MERVTGGEKGGKGDEERHKETRGGNKTREHEVEEGRKHAGK